MNKNKYNFDSPENILTTHQVMLNELRESITNLNMVVNKIAAEVGLLKQKIEKDKR